MRSFPWATFTINLSGSFILGVVLSLAVKRQWPDMATLPLPVGFLGAYTTFSTFSYESFTLLRADRATAAVIYVVVSVVGGLLAAWTGYSAARSPDEGQTIGLLDGGLRPLSRRTGRHRLGRGRLPVTLSRYDCALRG